VRSFPRITARRASRLSCALALGLCASLLVTVTGGPSATAGELKDRKQAVQKKIEKADHELDESSARLRRATQALSHAREQLTRARAELGDVRARLEVARQRDEEMKAALSAAEARLEQARSDVATGKVALREQREVVVDTITSIYEQGDPDLLAFTSILNAQTPADITRQREANSSLVQRQDHQYDDLRAAEVLLKVHEDEVEEATAEVAAKREEAAEHLVEMQQLTEEALAAKDRVRTMVGQRKDAEEMAVRAKRKDREALRQLRRQEARIDQLIQEAIRKARARAARKAARSNNGGPPVDTNGLLMHPVNGSVTSPFGYREHPIYHYWGLHDGVDFGAGCGAPLYAARGGRVLSEYYSSVWGNRLYLNVGMVNGKFITVIYNHLSRYNVGSGATVDRGDVVGYVGTTGWSTGCHLHFTVMENGKPVDPMKYF
jgi:murein DD-endopeptidase MepM/ murein hydrolase activator NlpD